MADYTFENAVTAAKSNPQNLDSIARTLFSKLTPEERLHLLDGDDAFWPGLHSMLTDGYNRRPITHGAVDRLGIPGVRFADGPRGCVVGESTAFPVPMARGATWDTDLEARIGLAIGREGRAQGANFFGGVCVNLPRHPAWGRIQETYGEDPVLLGEFGAALARGVQRNMMACAKHYALNSMENARFQVDVSIERDVLHEVYLPHFRRIIEEGVASIMSSYNSVRGEWAGQNKELLLDILRDQWGFRGFVMSDFLFGLRDGPLSVKNGLDIEAPFTNIRGRTLQDALEDGRITDADIERAGLSILRKEIEVDARREYPEPQSSVIFSAEHRKLAREAAGKSMTLLKNKEVDGEPVLPLSADVSKVAVIGRLANSKDTGDRGSSAVRCPEVISPYEGIKAALPNSEVILEDSSDVEKSRAAVAAADVVVVIVGYNWRDEGEYTVPPFQTSPSLKKILPPLDGTEKATYTNDLLINQVASVEVFNSGDNYGFGAGGDRESLRLRPADIRVIRAAVDANPRVVVSIMAAGAVIMSDWDSLPPAVLYSWYSGSEGGHALADILLGRINPSGRLPFSIPTTEEHLPHFDKDAMSIVYDRWHGQHLLDRMHVDAAYPLGFGLSYTDFTVSDLVAKQDEKNSEKMNVSVKAKNLGGRAGRFVAQTYAAANVPDRPRRVLLGFETVDLEADEEKQLSFVVSTRPVRRWNEGKWDLWTRHAELEVGRFSGDQQSARIVVHLEQ